MSFIFVENIKILIVFQFVHNHDCCCLIKPYLISNLFNYKNLNLTRTNSKTLLQKVENLLDLWRFFQVKFYTFKWFFNLQLFIKYVPFLLLKLQLNYFSFEIVCHAVSVMNFINSIFINIHIQRITKRILFVKGWVQ